MATDNKRKDFEKPDVDEEYLMNIMSGDQPVPDKPIPKSQEEIKESKPLSFLTKLMLTTVKRSEL